MYMCVTCQCGSNHPCSCALCGVEAMARSRSTDLTITQLPVISGGGSHQFFVPHHKLIVIDNTTFVRLDKYGSTTFAVLGCTRRGGADSNILDIIKTMRNAAMSKHTNTTAGHDNDDEWGKFINPSDSVRVRQKKKNLRGLLPEVLTIIAPSIDGGDGFTMRVACPDRTSSPVAVELTTDNIRYLRMAVRKWSAPRQDLHERRVRRRALKGVVHHKGLVRDNRNQRLLCRVQVTPDRKRTKVFNISKFDSEIDAATRAAEFMSRVPPTIIEVDSPTQPTDSSEPPVES